MILSRPNRIRTGVGAPEGLRVGPGRASSRGSGTWGPSHCDFSTQAPKLAFAALLRAAAASELVRVASSSGLSQRNFPGASALDYAVPSVSKKTSVIHLERESEKEEPWAGGGSSRRPAARRPNRGLCPEPRQVLPRPSHPHAHAVPSSNISVIIILLLLMSFCIVTVNSFTVMASVPAAQKGAALGSLRGLQVFSVLTAPCRAHPATVPCPTRPGAGPLPLNPQAWQRQGGEGG